MRRLRLFTVFHGNLDFSALPDRDLPLVISRCYWPLLTLAAEARIPLGIEMPARTLCRLADEDPQWVKSFRELADRGLLELVGSGWAQVIGPLAPVDVNRANLALGRDAYGDLLGEPPRTWFVGEQTFSAGLAPLYGEVGAQSLVMEWNNPASCRPELRPLRFRPAGLAAAAAPQISLLWNDCIFFQKLQRVVHGVCPVQEMMDAVARVYEADDAELLCVYGGDLEIFDYRPGRNNPGGAAEGVEMGRLAACLRALSADARYRFALPRDASRGLPAGPSVQLGSAADPIPCKKQPRYNPTRWAVSGRDGFGMNTQCFALRREQRMLSALDAVDSKSRRTSREAAPRALVELWGSDYRTRATEEKLEGFHAQMGVATARARAGLEGRIPALREGEDLVVANPWDEPWQGDPIEVEIQLPPGRFEFARVEAERAGALAVDASQLEVSSRHSDGSVRRATLVLEPRLAAGERIGLRLLAAPRAPAAKACAEAVCTEQVEAAFSLHRGGALRSLCFPRVDPAPLVGTVQHGTFDDIAYSPDFYSGHVVAVTETAGKVTDLAPVTEAATVVDAGPVRVSVEFQIETELGEWGKLYRVYRHQPRIDLVHTLRFNEARINSLRLAVVTALSDAFERETLRYAVVNGGEEPELFPLARGCSIGQQRAVSASVSARSCLGATEGWVSFGDARRGVAVIVDRSQAAAIPLLEFEDVDESFFLRVHHSMAEKDETRATFFRGLRRIACTLMGHRDELGAVRRVARGIERGLAYRTERGFGVARSL